MDMNALVKIVNAGITAKRTDDALRELGYNDTPYFSIYGNISDALYCMLGEKTDTYDQSFTCRILESLDLTDDMRAELLAAACAQA